jgi:uncharacterized membrane protein YebE (DUF533 family)
MMEQQNQNTQNAETKSAEVVSAPHMTQSLDEFKAAILEDGIIDDVEAGRIRQRVFADGKVDTEEADFLFALNNATTDKQNSPRWDALFVEAITAYVLEDDKTPGVVDDDEGTYLVQKIQGDGTVDTNEKTLLVNIWARATTIPQNLQNLINSTINS